MRDIIRPPGELIFINCKCNATRKEIHYHNHDYSNFATKFETVFLFSKMKYYCGYSFLKESVKLLNNYLSSGSIFHCSKIIIFLLL